MVTNERALAHSARTCGTMPHQTPDQEVTMHTYDVEYTVENCLSWMSDEMHLQDRREVRNRADRIARVRRTKETGVKCTNTSPRLVDWAGAFATCQASVTEKDLTQPVGFKGFQCDHWKASGQVGQVWAAYNRLHYVDLAAEVGAEVKRLARETRLPVETYLLRHDGHYR